MILLSLKSKNCSADNLIVSVSLNNADPSYQNNDFDRPVDVSIFEVPNDSSEFGQSKSLPLSENSTPWLDANDFAGSIVGSFAASQEGDVQWESGGTEMQQEYQAGQPDGKVTMLSNAFLPFPPNLIPPFMQVLEPSCPAGKKPFCCSGGKAANNIGKGCGECTIIPLRSVFGPLSDFLPSLLSVQGLLTTGSVFSNTLLCVAKDSW